MKLLKVKFKAETDTCLFCWVTYETRGFFSSSVKTELYSLEKDRFGYYPIANRCSDRGPLHGVKEIMILSKQQEVIL